MPYVIDGKIGVNLELTTSVAQYAVGTTVTTNDGGVFQYVKATSEISTYAAVLLYTDGGARMCETSAAGFAEIGQHVLGFAQVSIAQSYYGWVQRQGKVIFNVLDDCAAGVPLYTTTTPGHLDDATVSNCHVYGVFLTTTSSLATAMTGYAATPAFIDWYSNPA